MEKMYRALEEQMNDLRAKNEDIMNQLIELNAQKTKLQTDNGKYMDESRFYLLKPNSVHYRGNRLTVWNT